MGLHGLGDCLGALQRLRHALRRLRAADRIASDGGLADLKSLIFEPIRQIPVGVGRVSELQVELPLNIIRELVDRRAHPRPAAFLFRHRRRDRRSFLPRDRRLSW
ncbi:hypothetical protein SDC9_210680 [bioreactor metagenome]|uniref:Uncharacterized protein n=1 Tax=bioreactor metagenome TaxID=1076179 RepID=A0A645JHV5_9ZZZZ